MDFTRNPQTGRKKASPQAAELEARFRDAVQYPPPRPLENRSPQAAVKIAVNLAEEGLITKEEALQRVTPQQLDSLLVPSFETAEIRKATRAGRLTATGTGHGRGVASGRAAYDVPSAWRLQAQGERVILVCDAITYRERDVLPLLSGVVTRKGAELVAHHFEWPAVHTDDLPTEELVSLDAQTGQVFHGPLTLVPGSLSADAYTLLEWADEHKRLDVRANVTNADEAELAYALGATGVGLFRIESLLLQAHRLPLFQQALQRLPEPSPDLQEALTQDLTQLFQKVTSPFVVRLADVPLASLLRHWRDHGTPVESPWIDELNPLQGLRCGRLSLMFPALLELQVNACRNLKHLQLMMPGVCDAQELRILRQLAPDQEIGSMLEVPRACLQAGALAQEATFLSFGTGDLTETTCGISRYDAPLSFLPAYLEHGILPHDPFQQIDEDGVGELMRLAVAQARQANPQIQLGACGRQAAESIHFCHELGLDYVSVIPSRIPAARLAAAQAALAEPRRNTAAGTRRS